MRTKTGFRVVRGPDWNNQRQDNGEGFLGTIVYVPKEGSDDKKVTVIWDSGRELRYRAGIHGKYDLRVFDSAPAGVTHTGVICDSCKEKDIRGARWKCCDCGQYNMCSTCYMTDKHDVHHSFERIDSPQSSAVNVPPRADSKFSRRTARGLFSNVQVMRGPHWKWKNDDGGESGIGVIKEICTWGTNGYRGGVKVVWKSDRSVKNYRVGAEGCIDVICVDKTDTNTGGNYYCDHLPVVNVVDPEKIALKIGDKVIVNLPLKNFMEMQKDPIYGGWDEGLGQCLKETGTITSFLYGGKSARLQYEDSRTWLVNRMALFRKHTFSLRDPVKIHKDYKVVKELQKGHGGWNDEMKHALGKNGHIVRLDNEGDMMGDRLTKQAIAACTDNDNDDSDDTDDSDDDNYTEVSENLADFFYDLLQEEQTSADVNVSLVDAASKGNLDTIRRLIDETFKDQTALQVACYEGKYDTVVFLIQHGASVNLQDKAGDTALHLAANGNESDIIKHLAENGTNVNITNAKQQTALHITVNKSNWKGSNILIDKGADLVYSVVDLMVRLNKKCTTDKMSDGRTALHLAAETNKVEISHCLITTGKADINVKDIKGRTPLMSAVYSGGTLKSVEQLIKFECSVNAQDNSGDTALHILQTQKSSSMMRKRRGADDTQMLCFLLENGADVLIQNKNGKTPIDLTKDETEKLLIKTLAKKVIEKSFARTKSGFTFPADWDDMGKETILRVNIEPSKTDLMKQQWKDVKQMFDNTLPQARIVSIQRIQNKFNWEMYQVMKKKLEKQYGIGCANEQNLFHGTLPDKVDLIVEQNLDCRLAGTRVGTLLGKGTYFAKDAKYSDGYAQSDSNGHKFMFVYSVLAGKTCCGRDDYVKPPLQDINNPNLFLIAVLIMLLSLEYIVFSITHSIVQDI
ncbi:MIB [Mytilus edulis]|uniref:Poly [ADP-ribose] polymerase n=1 Tax=Mytilus edulis TaxID=6550 RepID=A0A8S3TRW4_MYTED|nr:MIB [Mytilus edulis]